MATKKKAEETKTAVKTASTKTSSKAAAKTATQTVAVKPAAEKAAAKKTPAAKKVVAKVAKKPAATTEKVAAKAAPAKKTTKAVAAKKVDEKVAPKAAKAKTAKASAEKKVTKTAGKAKSTKKASSKNAEEIVEVVESVSVEYDAPETLSQSFDAEYLVLMQKDPNWMQAFWEVSEERIKAAKKGKGKLVLRLFDISNDLTVKRNKKLKFHDVVVPADARSWYVENKSSNNCKAQLGVVTGSKFEPIVEAGPMQTFTLAGSDVNTDNVFVRASLGGATLGGFGSSGLSSMSAENWLENALNGLSSSSGSMFSGALSSAALKSNKLELPKDSVNYGKDFFLWVKTRLIVYGGTRPDAHLQVRGEPFPLNPDGTFSFEEDLPDVTKIIPVFATDKDGDFPTTIVPIVVKRTE
jgi:hypothetical protein